MPASPTRQDVEIRSGDDVVAAWFYPAATAAERAPCVVMSNGFSMTRADGLPAYAEAFAAAGTHALVFDPRYLGDSGGTPRQRFRIRAQRQDWEAVVQHARGRPDVDPTRVGAWGFSFGAGILTDLLGRGRLDVRAAMVLCPFVDGLRRVTTAPKRDVLRLVPYAARDVLGRHVTVPVTGEPGELGAMTFPGEAAGFAASRAARLLVAQRDLPRRAPRPRDLPTGTAGRPDPCPVVGGSVCRGHHCGRGRGRTHSRPGARGELHDFAGDHFAPFAGEVTGDVIQSQLAFWAKQV